MDMFTKFPGFHHFLDLITFLTKREVRICTMYSVINFA